MPVEKRKTTNCKGQLYKAFKSDFWNFQIFLQNREINKDIPIYFKIIANKKIIKKKKDIKWAHLQINYI